MSIITYSDVGFQVVPFGGLAGRIRDRFGPALAGMYDFTSPEGLYQDAASVSPVTATSQPVGLALDRRLPPGPELRPQGVVESIGSGATGSYDPVSGDGVVHRNSVANQSVVAFNGLDPLSQYRLGWTAAQTMAVRTDFTGEILSFGLAASGGALIFGPGYSRIVLARTSDSPNPSTVQGVSLRAIPGNHLTQPTTAARPTYTAQGARHDGVDDYLQAAAAGDWTFLHDGSGGTLGSCMMVEDADGSTANKMSGTRAGSGPGLRLGARTTSSMAMSGSIATESEEFIAETAPGLRGVFYRPISSTTAEELQFFNDGSFVQTVPIAGLSSGPPPFPLRTITAPGGRPSVLRRIIAIREAVTDPADIALIDAWLREGA